MPRVRAKLYEIVFGTDTYAGRLFDIVLMCAIIFSILEVMLESVPSLGTRYEHFFEIAEWTFTILFTLEYSIRLFI